MTTHPAFSFEADPWAVPGDTCRLTRDDYWHALDSISTWLETHTPYVLFSFLNPPDVTPDIEVVGSGAMTKIEKTIRLCAHSRRAISIDFIQYLQNWLRDGRQDWRIIIPTTRAIENWLTIYPTVFRIGERVNPSAADLQALAEQMKQEDPGLG